MKDAKINKRTLRLSGSARGVLVTGPYVTDGHFMIETAALDGKTRCKFETWETARAAGFTDATEGPKRETIERTVEGIGSKRWTVSPFGMVSGSNPAIPVRFLVPDPDANGDAGTGAIAVKEALLEICGFETGDILRGTDGNGAFIGRQEHGAAGVHGAESHGYDGPFRVIMPMRVSGEWPSEAIVQA